MDGGGSPRPLPSPEGSTTLPAWYVLVTSGPVEERAGASAPPEPFGRSAASGLERPTSGVWSVVRNGSFASAGFTGHLVQDYTGISSHDGLPTLQEQRGVFPRFDPLLPVRLRAAV